MLSYEQALDHLLSAAEPVAEIKAVPLAAANGRVLATDQISTLSVPPHDNSSMDGYAVRCCDLDAAVSALPVSQRIPAGSVGAPLVPGTLARIFTGAPVPPGADAVVMQEDCAPEEDGRVRVLRVPVAGENIRRTGEDIRAGSVVLPAGIRLGPAELGLAASVGLASLPVRRRLRVAVMSTGDELVEPGQPLPPGGIYNSNRYFLVPLLERLGCAVTDCGRIPDNLDETRKALASAAQGNDLILSTGGVSVGEEDHVKAAIEAEGVLDLWKIAIKPGKPLAFGKVGQKVDGGGTAEAGSTGCMGTAEAGSTGCMGTAEAGSTGINGTGASFIGLPGNPVSSFVTFLILVRPFLLRRMGAGWHGLPAITLPAASDWSHPDRKRREFLRARRTPEGAVELFPNQSSGVLTSCAWGDGLVDVPAGQPFRRGDAVRFIPFADLI